MILFFSFSNISPGKSDTLLKISKESKTNISPGMSFWQKSTPALKTAKLRLSVILKFWYIQHKLWPSQNIWTLRMSIPVLPVLTVENSLPLLTFHRRRLFSFMHFSDVAFKRITSCENFVTLGAYSGLWFLPFMNPINVTLHVAFVIKCLGAELTMVLFSFMNHQNVIQHGLFGRKVFHTMRT